MLSSFGKCNPLLALGRLLHTCLEVGKVFGPFFGLLAASHKAHTQAWK